MDFDADGVGPQCCSARRSSSGSRTSATCLLIRATSDLEQAEGRLRFIEATVAGSDTGLLLRPRCVPPRTTALLSRRRGNGRSLGRRGHRRLNTSLAALALQVQAWQPIEGLVKYGSEADRSSRPVDVPLAGQALTASVDMLQEICAFGLDET
jgi:hypothetical protein